MSLIFANIVAGSWRLRRDSRQRTGQHSGRLAVTRVLNQLAIIRGLPRVLRTDNALEFCGRAMLTWAHERRVTLRLIEPRKRNQNAYIESFNGRFRDECLYEHWFTSLAPFGAAVRRRVPLIDQSGFGIF
jgi:transposase InsO family protein